MRRLPGPAGRIGCRHDPSTRPEGRSRTTPAARLSAPGEGAPAGIPQFAVDLAAPEIAPWMPGNTGVRGFTTFGSGVPGPHVAVIALLHGNEYAGAIVLDRLLRQGVRPVCGQLTFGFANIAAFARFDPAQPTASRFLDEDMNRLWSPAVLDGPRRSVELDRARDLRPLIETVDVLLDLHSMLWPSEPLILSGPSVQGRALAMRLGVPGLVVSDSGHAMGPRLIDFPHFTGGAAAACRVEAGQHWQPPTVDVTAACVAAVLREAGLP
ncbi:MAG: succinylglutamate desuccinylase/aspartoacylase family protein, partial [Gemmatimonadaceae bacterium]|nr:succinylglutamate desuccinylase/aspartoacylase family protein [Acetobacteraceae bacterium]